MAYQRIDSLDVTFEDCCARQELKVKEKRVHTNGKKARKGVGEKRIYIGHDKSLLDAFFEFESEPQFFLQKDDLEEYSLAIQQELRKPQFHYEAGKELGSLWTEYREKLNNLKNSRLELKFSPTYDSQKRYYIVLPRRNKQNLFLHENWSYVRDICLPRVSRLLFIKLRDDTTQQISIYIKPFYSGRKSKGVSSLVSRRSGQSKYRDSILEFYKNCVVTGVENRNTLIACHIKGFSDCNQQEKYDKFNGFMMTPTIHTLFDLGYLSFSLDGELILSDFLNDKDRQKLHLASNETIKVNLREETKSYLKWHNDHTFIRTSSELNLDK